MSELLELRLEVLPGWIRASGNLEAEAAAAEGAGRRNGKSGTGTQEQGQRVECSLSLALWPAGRKKEVLNRLAGHPGELYDLLQGSLGSGLAALNLLPADAELEQAVQEQGTGQMPADELLLHLKQRLEKEPLLALVLRGLSKEELLSGVFALWADQENGQGPEAGAAPPVSLAAELAKLERKGPAVSSGEWLAEAAAEGSLHQPGPLFHEISARPFPAVADVIEPKEDWSRLLPQTPKAPEGLALLMRRVSEAAAKRAAGLSKL